MPTEHQSNSLKSPYHGHLYLLYGPEPLSKMSSNPPRMTKSDHQSSYGSVETVDDQLTSRRRLLVRSECLYRARSASQAGPCETSLLQTLQV